jgi:hypothetical protein
MFVDIYRALTHPHTLKDESRNLLRRIPRCHDYAAVKVCCAHHSSVVTLSTSPENQEFRDQQSTRHACMRMAFPGAILSAHPPPPLALRNRTVEATHSPFQKLQTSRKRRET